MHGIKISNQLYSKILKHIYSRKCVQLVHFESVLPSGNKRVRNYLYELKIKLWVMSKCTKFCSTYHRVYRHHE